MTTQTQPTAQDLAAMVAALQVQLAALQEPNKTADSPHWPAYKPGQPMTVVSEAARKTFPNTKPVTDSKRPVKVNITPADKFDALEVGKAVAVVPGKHQLTYREAQDLCGKLGLKASGKYDALLTRIGRHDAGTSTAEDYAKGKGKNSIKVLRAECAKYAIKAGGSAKVLADRIAAHHAGTLEQEHYKKANKGQGRVKKEKAAPRTAFGLDYRRAQRMVSYLKKQMPAASLPDSLVKNMGWDSVEDNLTLLLTTPWFAGLDVKAIKEMAKACVLTDDMFQAFVAEVGL